MSWFIGGSSSFWDYFSVEGYLQIAEDADDARHIAHKTAISTKRAFSANAWRDLACS
jgi:hypothetical protein